MNSYLQIWIHMQGLWVQLVGSVGHQDGVVEPYVVPVCPHAGQEFPKPGRVTLRHEHTNADARRPLAPIWPVRTGHGWVAHQLVRESVCPKDVSVHVYSTVGTQYVGPDCKMVVKI